MAQKVKLNIGGEYFHTSKDTLCMSSRYFKKMFGGSWSRLVDSDDNAIFIDRDPTYFKDILNYMRNNVINLDIMTAEKLTAIWVEAEFYQIDTLLALLKETDQVLQHVTEDPKFTDLKPGEFILSHNMAAKTENEGTHWISHKLIPCRLIHFPVYSLEMEPRRELDVYEQNFEVIFNPMDPTVVYLDPKSTSVTKWMVKVRESLTRELAQKMDPEFTNPMGRHLNFEKLSARPLLGGPVYTVRLDENVEIELPEETCPTDIELPQSLEQLVGFIEKTLLKKLHWSVELTMSLLTVRVIPVSTYDIYSNLRIGDSQWCITKLTFVEEKEYTYPLFQLESNHWDGPKQNQQQEQHDQTKDQEVEEEEEKVGSEEELIRTVIPNYGVKKYKSNYKILDIRTCRYLNSKWTPLPLGDLITVDKRPEQQGQKEQVQGTHNKEYRSATPVSFYSTYSDSDDGISEDIPEEDELKEQEKQESEDEKEARDIEPPSFTYSFYKNGSDSDDGETPTIDYPETE